MSYSQTAYCYGSGANLHPPRTCVSVWCQSVVVAYIVRIANDFTQASAGEVTPFTVMVNSGIFFVRDANSVTAAVTSVGLTCLKSIVLATMFSGSLAWYERGLRR